MIIKNVMVAGAGLLGSQVSWQIACSGFNVTVYDAFEEGLKAGRKYHEQYGELFMSTRGASQQDIDQTMTRLNYTTSLAVAARDADLVSESVPENLDIKKKFYRDLSAVAPEKTIFTTNTSTILPSLFAEDTGRPAKFLALHFANGIWDRNVGEVMGHSGTDSEIFNQIVEFTKNIGMIAIPIHKEQAGYILNTILVPLLSAAGDLLVNGVSDYESVDKAWMIGVGVPMGPFALLDMVGIDLAHDVHKYRGELLNDQADLKRAAFYKKNFVEKNKLGMKTGQGFYTYPNPGWKDPNFLK